MKIGHDHFGDHFVNIYADLILCHIEDYSTPLEKIGAALAGYETESPVSEEDTKIFQDINENGIELAEELYEEVLKTLKPLVEKINVNHPNYHQLINKLVATITVMIKTRAGSLAMLTITSDFNEDKKFVESTKLELGKGKKLLEIMSLMNLSQEITPIITGTTNMVNEALKRTNPKKSFFNLFN